LIKINYMKKYLILGGFVLVIIYLIFAIFFFGNKQSDQICNHFDVVINDGYGTDLIEAAEIEKQIEELGLNPYGKPIKEINTYEIEQAILSNQMVKSVEVFITNNGGIRAILKNRKPILRIITASGENYYIDNEGQKVPFSKNFVADLPLATGIINEEFAKTELFEFANFLNNNEFWDNLIEQIVVLPNEEIKLIPRIGDQEVLLGKFDDYPEKLDKLKLFYEKGLSEVGWNRYSVINLKYNKQVVATKR